MTEIVPSISPKSLKSLKIHSTVLTESHSSNSSMTIHLIQKRLYTQNNTHFLQQDHIQWRWIYRQDLGSALVVNILWNLLENIGCEVKHLKKYSRIYGRSHRDLVIDLRKDWILSRNQSF